MVERLSLSEQQYRFAAHIRDPANNPAPDGIEDRRLAIYRELFFNNVSKFLASTFRVIRKILGEEAWIRLMRDYFAKHRAETPLFPEMPYEFVRYLEAERDPQADDPPFLLELAHYEWVELALAVDAAEPDLDDIDREGNLLEGLPVLSPLAWPLAYKFPVHRIRPDFQPAAADEQPTFLVVYRDLADKVGFIEINAVTARLLELLGSTGNELKTGRAILELCAAEIKHPEPATVVQGGAEILNNLRRHDVILGTRTTH